MELTGKLKEQVEKAETKEEKKSLIEDAGMELNDEELDQISGGVKGRWDVSVDFWDVNGHSK